MFKVFNKILKQQPITQEDADKVQTFVLLRWLSADPRLYQLANTLNQVEVDKLILLRAISKTLKGKIAFIQYPKSNKVKDDVTIKLLQNYYNLGYNEANDYLEFCQNYCPEELEILNKKYEGIKC